MSVVPDRPIIQVQRLHKWFGPLHFLRGVNMEVRVGGGDTGSTP